MPKSQHSGACKGFKVDGTPCGGFPSAGEQYCYWCVRKPERQRPPKAGEVVDLKTAKAAREQGSMTVEDYEELLERIILGEELETKQTSEGRSFTAEASVKDKLAAGRELRQLRGWHGDDSSNAADRLGFSIADLVRDKLGI